MGTKMNSLFFKMWHKNKGEKRSLWQCFENGNLQKEVCKRSDFGQNGNKIWVRSSEASIYEGLSGVLGAKK